MFQVFPLCRPFFLLKKCMCLLEPNDYYPYSMPMKPTIKTNLKMTKNQNFKNFFNFLLALE